MVEQRIEPQDVDHRGDHHRRAVRRLGHGAHILVADRMKHEPVILIGIGGQSDKRQV